MATVCTVRLDGQVRGAGLVASTAHGQSYASQSTVESEEKSIFSFGGALLSLILTSTSGTYDIHSDGDKGIGRTHCSENECGSERWATCQGHPALTQACLTWKPVLCP